MQTISTKIYIDSYSISGYHRLVIDSTEVNDVMPDIDALYVVKILRKSIENAHHVQRLAKILAHAQ